MIHIIKSLTLCVLLTLGCMCTAAEYQFYTGILGGYGSTNWTRISTSDPALQASLPKSAQDSGFTGGIFVGDNINQNFGLEARYQHFADSTVSFGYTSYHSNDKPFTMTSKTSAIMLLAKFRLPLGARWEAYSIAGGTFTLRSDSIANVNGLGGVFGGGTDFAFNAHWHNSIEFDFATGNATINELPAKNYQPFLTALVDKVIYFF